MVWCGVVWCGVLWCGVVWCGVVLPGVVWCCLVWCGVVCCCLVWCGVVWCGVLLSVAWCGVVCLARYEKARKSRDFGFERDFERELQIFVADCDKRIAVRGTLGMRGFYARNGGGGSHLASLPASCVDRWARC